MWIAELGCGARGHLGGGGGRGARGGVGLRRMGSHHRAGTNKPT